MIIQSLLIIPLTLFFLYFIKNSSKAHIQAWKKILFSLFLMFGMISIIFPEIPDIVARKLGIGRGADLLLYLLTISFIFLVINIYVKFREVSLRQNKIISRIAILEADKERGKDIQPEDSV